MNSNNSAIRIEDQKNHDKFYLAIKIWLVFIALLIFINDLIPLIFGLNLYSWTYSIFKNFLFSVVIYAGVFLVVPIIMVKGWENVRKPAFLIPLLIAVLGISLTWLVNPFTASIVVIVLAYLHLRFDLSDLGIRSRGFKGDVIAIIFIGILNLIPVLLQGNFHTSSINNALLAGISRLFANPASTVENLFYFGFLTELIVHKLGRWTPILIGVMYTIHEITNPEYWFENTSFIFIFIGIVIITLIYIWRRNIVAIWLGDGLGRFLSQLF